MCAIGVLEQLAVGDVIEGSTAAGIVPIGTRTLSEDVEMVEVEPLRGCIEVPPGVEPVNFCDVAPPGVEPVGVCDK